MAVPISTGGCEHQSLIETTMKNLIHCYAAYCLALVLLAVLSAGCTRVDEPVLPPPMPVDAAPTFDPLMASARDWLQARKYVFSTNVEEEVTSFQTYFADLPGDAASASCSIHGGTNGDMLTINAVLLPLAGRGQDDTFDSWVAAANSQSQWGFFGFDSINRQIWFRISLFRPTGKVSVSDMDRLISEVIEAIHQWSEFTAEHEIMETPASDGNITNPPDDQLHGIQQPKPATAPPKSKLINYLKPVNYVRLQNEKK
jgi:hypothetical protein